MSARSNSVDFRIPAQNDMQLSKISSEENAQLDSYGQNDSIFWKKLKFSSWISFCAAQWIVLDADLPGAAFRPDVLKMIFFLWEKIIYRVTFLCN